MTEAQNRTSTKTLRDFLYVDAARVRSLYAQIFESVTEDVVRERLVQELNAEINTVAESARNSDSASERETQGISGLRSSERGVLHDHMYNQLERALGDAIANMADVPEQGIAAEYMRSPFVRVQGVMEIEDYGRVREFVEEFNKLGEAIASAGMTTEASVKRRQELEALRKTSLRPDERKSLEQELKTLSSSLERAKALGLHRDPKQLEALKLFIDMFAGNSYHIVIADSPTSPIRHKGVLQAPFLRVDPGVVRTLYGNQSSATWTMVGSVSFVPATFDHWHNEDSEDGRIINELVNMPSLVDAVRKMTRSARVFEQAFLESANTFEVVMSPLAVYREFSIG